MLTNKTMSILYRGLTEEEIMERLDSHNVKYVWKFGADNTSTIIYGKYIVKFINFVNNICIKVLDKQ